MRAEKVGHGCHPSDDNHDIEPYLALIEILSPGIYLLSSPCGWIELMEHKPLSEQLKWGRGLGIGTAEI